jgi:hypothetical protein
MNMKTKNPEYNAALRRGAANKKRAREMWASGAAISAIAAKLKLSRQYVGRILRGEK